MLFRCKNFNFKFCTICKYCVRRRCNEIS